MTHDAPGFRITPQVISILDYGKGFGHKADVALTASGQVAA